jgi:hypothetical protein
MHHGVQEEGQLGLKGPRDAAGTIEPVALALEGEIAVRDALTALQEVVRHREFRSYGLSCGLHLRSAAPATDPNQPLPVAAIASGG